MRNFINTARFLFLLAATSMLVADAAYAANTHSERLVSSSERDGGLEAASERLRAAPSSERSGGLEAASERLRAAPSSERDGGLEAASESLRVADADEFPLGAVNPSITSVSPTSVSEGTTATLAGPIATGVGSTSGAVITVLSGASSAGQGASSASGSTGSSSASSDVGSSSASSGVGSSSASGGIGSSSASSGVGSSSASSGVGSSSASGSTLAISGAAGSDSASSSTRVIPIRSSSAGAASGPHGQANEAAGDDARESAEAVSFPDAEATFEQVRKLLLERHVDTELTSDLLYKAAVEGMLRRASEEVSKADHKSWCSSCSTNYLLSPAGKEKRQQALVGKSVGFGIIIEPNVADGTLIVARVMENSPAKRGGLRDKDQILSINGRLLDGLDSWRMLGELRSDPGVPLTLEVLRKGKKLELQVARGEVDFEMATGELLPPDIGVIRIHAFVDKTAKQLKGLLEQLEARQARGLVLDLRSCSSGRLEMAIQTLDVLLPRGVLALKVHARVGEEQALFSSNEPVLNVPIAVLIDKETCSSAEIVAQALRDQLGAPLVGQPTRGKTTAEEVVDLDNGYAMLMSTKRLLTASGETWKDGLVPDVKVEHRERDLCRSFLATNVKERLKLDLALAAAIRELTH